MTDLQPSGSLRAEIVAVGDELTSGQRLDTNSQWISQRLNELGIPVAFHSTAGDDLADMLAVFGQAARRCGLVIVTGGLGPTADDLTRQALAELTDRPLELHRDSLEHIARLFARRGRQMPDSNRVQAYFPRGANVVPNPHGTAPGVSLDFEHSGGEQASRRSLVIALPGVPAELKPMWFADVEPMLRKRYATHRRIFHHTLNCFGLGESEIEARLPDLVRRGQHPQVGITASQATISLRIQASCPDETSFQQTIEPTVQLIRDCLGELIYGENEQTLSEVVSGQLRILGRTVAVADIGHRGLVSHWLSQENEASDHLKAALTFPTATAARRWLQRWFPTEDPTKDDNLTESTNLLVDLANLLRDISQSDDVLVYSVEQLNSGDARDDDPSEVDERDCLVVLAMNGGGEIETQVWRQASHPAIREVRIGKWILNQYRLWLAQRER